MMPAQTRAYDVYLCAFSVALIYTINYEQEAPRGVGDLTKAKWLHDEQIWLRFESLLK